MQATQAQLNSQRSVDIQALEDQYAGQSPKPTAYYTALGNLEEAYRKAFADSAYTYGVSMADLNQTFVQGNVTREFQWKEALAALDKQLADKVAEHKHWEEARKITARHVLDTRTAADQKKYNVAMYEANRVKTRALAEATRDKEVAYATAEIAQWNAKEVAKAAAVSTWDDQVQTPWSEYQKKIAANAVEYATNIAPKLHDQAEHDADSALTEVNTVADKRKDLQSGAAELRLVRKVADLTSWKTFRLAANDEVKDEAVKKAQRLTEHNTALSAAEKNFGNSEAAANGTRERDIAQAAKDTNYDDAEDYGESIRQQDASLYTGAEQARLIENYRDLATLWKTHSNGLTTARETRSLALSLAEKNNVVNTSLDKKGREHRLTAAFAAYQVAAADHAQTFATDYSDKYKTFVEGVAEADATASKDFAAHEKTLADADAEAQKTWNDSDTTALKEFYVEAAQKFVDTMVAWAAPWNTPYTSLLVGLAQVELTRVTNLGTALVTHATSAGSQLVTFLTQLTAKSKTLADGVAGGLQTQTDSLAGALKQYAGNVATARHTYALALAEKTALHDTNVASRNHTYKEAQAGREKSYRDAYDAAQWAYERSYTEAKYEVDYAHLWHQGSPEYGAAAAALGQAEQGFALTRRNAQAQAQRDKTVGLAIDHASWVHDIGDIHVMLADDAKTAADALAASLKSASDGLTGDQAAAANALAQALAGAEKEYATGTATSQANNDKELAKVDGTLSKDLTGVANQEREGTAQKRGQYEVALYQAHADALEAGVLSATTTGIWSGGGTSQPVTDLLTYQKLAAAADAVWAAGAAAAKQAYEALLSTAYANLADDEYGLEGAVTVQIGASADAAKDQAAGLAGADEALSVASTANLAGFTVGVQGAASKAAKEGVQAETQYDVARAAAKATYLTAVANADKVKATTIADAELAFLQAAPLNYETGGWLSTPAGMEATATRNSAISAASAEYDDAVKTAKVTHAGQITVAQVVRVLTLGGALITEAGEAASSEIAYVGQQNASELAYEQTVTTVTSAAVGALAQVALVYANAATGNIAGLIVDLGAAAVGLATDMKPVNVTHTTSVAGYEGQYHTAVTQDGADRAAAAAVGSGPTSQLAFAAAEAQAVAAWTSGMTGPFTTYATAMATAEADEIIELAQALATADNSRAQADVTRTIGCEPVYYNERVNSHAAERVYVEGETARVGARRLAEAIVYKLLDIEYATAAKNQAVSSAEAEGAFWVGKFGLAEGASDTSLAHTRDLAKADADLAYVTAKANADFEWLNGRAAIPPSAEDPDGEPAVAGIVAGGCTEQQERATGWRNLNVTLADIARDTSIGCLPHIETQTNSYAAAQVNFWNAEVAAAAARNTAEANALANFRTADYAQTASAVAGIHTAMNLPWTQYQADLAAAMSAWWVGSEKANFLGFASAVDIAEAAYQTTVSTAFLAWASSTAAAERTFATAQANIDYDRAERDLDADAEYLRELAGLDEEWQIDFMTAKRTHDVAVATSQRNFIDTGDTAARDAANAAAESAFASSQRSITQEYTIDEAQAHGTLANIRSGSDCTRIGQSNTSGLTYVTSASGADEAYTTAEANAQYTRLAALALAEKNYDLAQTDTLEDVLEALATASNTPWATYDAAVAAADEVFTNSVAPARYDLLVSQADADRDYEIAVALASTTLRTSLETHTAAHRTTAVNAARDRTLAEVLADIGISENIPINFLTPHRDGATSAVSGDAPNAEEPNTEAGKDTPSPKRPTTEPPAKSPLPPVKASIPSADPTDPANLDPPFAIPTATVELRKLPYWTPHSWFLAKYVDTFSSNNYRSDISAIRLGRSVGRYTADGQLQVGFMIERLQWVAAPGPAPWWWSSNWGEYSVQKWVETGEVIWGLPFPEDGTISFAQFVEKQRGQVWVKLKGDVWQDAANYGQGFTEGAFDLSIDLVAQRLGVGGVGRMLRETLLDGAPSGDALVDAGFQTLLMRMPQASAVAVHGWEYRNVGLFARITPKTLGIKSIADDARLARFWEESIKELYYGKGTDGIRLRRYLDAINTKKGPSPAQMKQAWESVKRKFMIKVDEAKAAGEVFDGYNFETIHHWNWTRKMHSAYLLDPRQLFPLSEVKEQVVHGFTTIGPHHYYNPINPWHAMDLDGGGTPLAPP